ncbi:unnamed protein product [Trifolium pratense]|uniref:Uncharacterized protein n=1 Tax=Trifolium pratense TaxID=57577 RepID=A0ACB0K816_TRIPR|nr:unnamed protein product [Trifolium pratense]
MAQNEYRVENDRGAKKKAGMLELDTQTALLAQSTLMNSQMAAVLKHLTSTSNSQMPVMAANEVKCDFCGQGHANGQCFPEGSEEAKYLANFKRNNPKYDPYSNTYNPGWRDHPNFGWGGNQNSNQSQQQSSSQNSQQRRPSQLEDTLTQFIKVTQGNFEAMKIDVIEEVAEDVLIKETPSFTLERVIVNSIDDLEEEWDKEIEICLRQLESCKEEEAQKDFENVYVVEEKASGKEDLKVTIPELKELPPHLKYVFLGEDASQPAIISSRLSSLEAEKLTRVLRENKEAMGWSISDLKGISPGFCMHKIKMEDEYKPVVQPQRRLNPTMKEVRKDCLS